MQWFSIIKKIINYFLNLLFIKLVLSINSIKKIGGINMLYKICSTGSDIRIIQNDLKMLRLWSTEYWLYLWPKTETAVKEFQKSYVLAEEWIVGPEIISVSNIKWAKSIIKFYIVLFCKIW